MGQLSHNVNEDESERTYSHPHTQSHRTTKIWFDIIEDYTKLFLWKFFVKKALFEFDWFAETRIVYIQSGITRNRYYE